MNRTRRDFLRVASAAGLGTAFLPCFARGQSAIGSQPSAMPSPPNIVVMMADDAGYSDFSCYGSPMIQTPNIDKLAAEGVRFTDYYAAAPNCSPSRAAMLTGRTPSRVGVYTYCNPKPMHLPHSEITTAQLLGSAGYDTAYFGKWHLTANRQKGDPENFVGKGYGFRYVMTCESNASRDWALKDGDRFEFIGKQPERNARHLADDINQWLESGRDKSKPFFLNIWFHEPHAPVHPDPEFVEKHADKKKNEAYIAATVETMDAAIGRIMAKLDELGLRENTLVHFTSDNGGLTKQSNLPFTGGKSRITEGGIREPGIFRWPGHIEPGTVNTTPAQFVDLLPTFCELAGINPPTDRILDGVSLVPLLRQKPGSIHRDKPLFWFFYRAAPACAIREGKWNLVGYLDEKCPKGHGFSAEHMAYLKRAKLAKFELYDLESDPAQKKDLSKQNPELFERLKKQMIALHAEVIKEGPDWYPENKNK